MTFSAAPGGSTRSKAPFALEKGGAVADQVSEASQCSGKVPAICCGQEDSAAFVKPACRPRKPLDRTADRARSVVGEHSGGVNDTGTDAGSVLTAELAGSAPPQADGIVR
jgi:hypothetical protein